MSSGHSPPQSLVDHHSPRLPNVNNEIDKISSTRTTPIASSTIRSRTKSGTRPGTKSSTRPDPRSNVTSAFSSMESLKSLSLKSFQPLANQLSQPSGLQLPQRNAPAVSQPFLLALSEKVDPRIFDSLTFPPERDSSTNIQRNELTGTIVTITKPRLIALLTQHDVLDYSTMLDFFLCFRSYLTSTELLDLLFARLSWSLHFHLTNSELSEVGRDTAVRTFVVLRHWILNFFADDFVTNFQLRSHFCICLNNLAQWYSMFQLTQSATNRAVVIRIFEQLKKAWARLCESYWPTGSTEFLTTNYKDLKLAPISPGGAFGSVNIGGVDSRETTKLNNNPRSRRSILLASYTELPKPILSDTELHANTLAIGDIIGGLQVPLASNLATSVQSITASKLTADPVTSNTPGKGLPSERNYLNDHLNEKNHKKEVQKPRRHLLSRFLSVLDIKAPLHHHQSSTTTITTTTKHQYTQSASSHHQSQAQQLYSGVDLLSMRAISELARIKDNLAPENLGSRISTSTAMVMVDHDTIHHENLENQSVYFSEGPSHLQFLPNGIPDEIPENTPENFTNDIHENVPEAVEELSENILEGIHGLPSHALAYEDSRETLSLVSSSHSLAGSGEFHYSGGLEQSIEHSVEDTLDIDQQLMPDSASDISQLSRQPYIKTSDISTRSFGSNNVHENLNIKFSRGSNPDDTNTFYQFAVPESFDSFVSGTTASLSTATDSDSYGKEPTTTTFVTSPGRGQLRRQVGLQNIHKETIEHHDSEPSSANGSANGSADNSTNGSPTDLKARQFSMVTVGSIGTSLDTEDSLITASMKSRTPNPDYSAGSGSGSEEDAGDYPVGVNAKAAAELAAIPDDTPEDDAIIAALAKLEGTYAKSDSKSRHLADANTEDAMIPSEQQQGYAYDHGPETSAVESPRDGEDDYFSGSEHSLELRDSRYVNLCSETDLLKFKNSSYSDAVDLSRDFSAINLSSLSAFPIVESESKHSNLYSAAFESRFNISQLNIPMFESTGVVSSKSPETGPVDSSPIDSSPTDSFLVENVSETRRQTADDLAADVLSQSTAVISPSPTVTNMSSALSGSSLPLDASSANHIPFVLFYETDVICQQLSLIEKDALSDVDWKELVDLSCRKHLEPVTSWLSVLLNKQYSGVELAITRFNLAVNWVKSEVILTQNVDIRAAVISKFIMIAKAARKAQNYATMMQIVLALTSDLIQQRIGSSTWQKIPVEHLGVLKALEDVISPTRNFQRLRSEINSMDHSKGCIPFVGVYLSDLTSNDERPTFFDADKRMLNFDKLVTTAAIVRSFLQCIEWSSNYKDSQVDRELLAKCLYIESLTMEEMEQCVKRIRAMEG